MISSRRVRASVPSARARCAARAIAVLPCLRATRAPGTEPSRMAPPADLAEAGRLVIGRWPAGALKSPLSNAILAAAHRQQWARAAINALLRLPEVRRLLRGDFQTVATSGALEFPGRFTEVRGPASAHQSPGLSSSWWTGF